LPFQGIDSFFAPAPDARAVSWLGQQAYAHRGLHGQGVPENSPAAFRGAVDKRLGIECDVRLTRDGRAIVFHDATLERLTGREGVVDQLTLDELTTINYPEGGETLPALSDLLHLVAGQVPLLVEIKVDRGQSVGILCRTVARDLQGYAGKIAVMSFDPRVGAWFARHAAGVVRGLIVTEKGRRSWLESTKRHLSLWHARPHFLAYDIRDLPSPFAASQRGRGLPLLTWTVSSPELRERAKAHADAPIAEGQGLA
jgi:glycerophosphoryl diester phosphodiesterase